MHTVCKTISVFEFFCLCLLQLTLNKQQEELQEDPLEYYDHQTAQIEVIQKIYIIFSLCVVISNSFLTITAYSCKYSYIAYNFRASGSRYQYAEYLNLFWMSACCSLSVSIWRSPALCVKGAHLTRSDRLSVNLLCSKSFSMVCQSSLLTLDLWSV